MTSPKAQRTTWFELGARALTQARPEFAGQYVCPLCMASFPLSAVQDKTLTFEHAPPGSLGGGRVALTCKDCNSRAGAKLDAEMESFETVLDFHCGTMTEPRRGRLLIGSYNIVVDYQAIGDTVRVNILPDYQSNKPGTEEALKGFLADLSETGRWEEFQFKLNLLGFRYKPALIGWLRSAYIVAFSALGYRYIYQDALNVVRSQINDVGAEIMRVFSVTATNEPNNEPQLLIIEQPERLADCVAMHVRRHMIFLPGLSAGLDVYARLEKELSNNAECHEIFTGKLIPWPHRPVHGLDFY